MTDPRRRKRKGTRTCHAPRWPSLTSFHWIFILFLQSELDAWAGSESDCVARFTVTSTDHFPGLLSAWKTPKHTFLRTPWTPDP